MFRSFTIQNFRCFRALAVTQLDRVNLIAGKNNVGKTALLEAIFLHLGPNNPHLALRINVLRGIDQLDADARELWGWLFFEKRVDQSIHLESRDEQKVRRSLEIRLVEVGQSLVSATRASNGGTASSTGSFTTGVDPRELVLEYRDSARQVATSRMAVDAGQLKATTAKLAPYPLGVLLSANLRADREDAERFSKLEAVGRQDELLPTLRLLEPRLRRLAVLIVGGVPMINGDIGIGTLVPLPVMGEGIGRLLSILLAIVSAPGGTVLIDEVENGLHHSVMAGVWTAIAVAARQFDVQVFATTHSWECIQAAQQAFVAAEPYDLRLHRLERVDGDLQVVTYDQESLGAAVQAEIEVR